MKKALLTLALAAATTVGAMAFPKALYVKQGDAFTKYNFGVAGDLKFSNNGRTLTITGYAEAINLDEVDYITFNAPIDGLALTPNAQKDKLLQIGEDINSRIDIDKYADVINMWHGFFDSGYGSDQQWRKAPVDYWLDPDFYDIFNDARGMMDAAGQMVRGNAAAARILKAKAVNLYKLEDYYGIYTANDKDMRWDKTTADGYLEIRFKGFSGESYTLRLDASADYTQWDTADANVRLPKTMAITFRKDGKDIAAATIKTTLVQNTSIDVTVEFTCNDLYARNYMAVVDDGLSDAVIVRVAGEDFVTSNTHVVGRHLVNYDSIKDAIDATQHSHDQYGNCLDDEDMHPLLSHFVRATADVDVLGELQVKAKLFDVTNFYDVMSGESEIDEEYVDEEGFSVWTYGKVIATENNNYLISSDDSKYYDRLGSHLNSYTDASFYYDGTRQLQGFLGWEVSDEDEDRWMGTDDAYALVGDNLLVYLRHEDVYEEDEYGNQVYVGQSDYLGYEMYRYTDNSYERKFVRVPDNKVIRPNTLTERWYNNMPVLIFPDLSSYSFEDYFDEVSFKKLIDDYYDIIDTYYDITGQDGNAYNPEY